MVQRVGHGQQESLTSDMLHGRALPACMHADAPPRHAEPPNNHGACVFNLTKSIFGAGMMVRSSSQTPLFHAPSGPAHGRGPAGGVLWRGQGRVQGVRLLGAGVGLEEKIRPLSLECWRRWRGSGHLGAFSNITHNPICIIYSPYPYGCSVASRCWWRLVLVATRRSPVQLTCPLPRSPQAE
jgi:hypothetical protein